MFKTEKNICITTFFIFRFAVLDFAIYQGVPWYCFPGPIGGGVNWSPLHHIMGILRNAQRLINRLVDLIDHHGFGDGFAGPFVSSFAINQALLDTAAPHQDRATIGKVPVHAVVLEVFDLVGLRNLVSDLLSRSAFQQTITAKLRGQYYQRSIQMAALFQVLDQLGNGPINVLLHFDEAGMTIFVGIPTEKGFVLGGYADETGSLHDQAFGHETTQTKAPGIVNGIRFRVFLLQVKGPHFRGFQQAIGLLHAAHQRFLLVIAALFAQGTLLCQFPVQNDVYAQNAAGPCRRVDGHFPAR